jgi:hypothetical protein
MVVLVGLVVKNFDFFLAAGFDYGNLFYSVLYSILYSTTFDKGERRGTSTAKVLDNDGEDDQDAKE